MKQRVLGSVLPAVAVVALTVGCGGDHEPRSEPAPASATSTATSTTTPPRPTAWVAGLPVGSPPAVGYVIGHVYHSPSGRTVRLPRDRGITWLSPLGDGWLATDDRYFEGTVGVLRLDAAGRLVGEIGTITGTPVLSDDGATLRWITFSPSEVGPADRSPTRLHVADVATGDVRSRVIDRSGDSLPHVRHRDQEAWPRMVLPGRKQARVVAARVWEDRSHVLVGVVRRNQDAAILRYDVRARAWALAIDWTPTEKTYGVTFETLR